MLFVYTYQDPRMLSATQIPAFSASNISCAFGTYRIFAYHISKPLIISSQFPPVLSRVLLSSPMLHLVPYFLQLLTNCSFHFLEASVCVRKGGNFKPFPLLTLDTMAVCVTISIYHVTQIPKFSYYLKPLQCQ